MRCAYMVEKVLYNGFISAYDLGVERRESAPQIVEAPTRYVSHFGETRVKLALSR